LDFDRDRRTPFSFACRACGQCCAGKIIMAGPHEVLGMARLLGIGTTEFLSRYTDNGGTTLRFREDGRCSFLTPEGCRVHPRRPLVCRLYPLGRATDGEGDEKFALFPKEAGCKAEYGEDGTIETFLESQGVGPYIEWSRRYGDLYRRMLGLLDRLEIQGKVEVSGADGTDGTGGGGGPELGASEGQERPGEADRSPLSEWQDVDASLAEYCAAKRLAVPEAIEDAIALHLRAIGEWLDGLESRVGEKPKDPQGAKRS
jgi:Fe-S-cluster containining protein